MPIRGAPPKSAKVLADKEALLKKIDEAKRKIDEKKAINATFNIDDESDDEEDVKTKALGKYNRIIDDTADLKLDVLVKTRDGFRIFNKLCLKLDLNQRFAECLPQWSDVADKLNIDDLSTRWVETCVRPKEGLTRAMLEIYMKDGGTLGDVLRALKNLECLEILEVLSADVERYILNVKNKADDKTVGTSSTAIDPFFILKTLYKKLGPVNDPMPELYVYMNGLKSSQPPPLEHSVLVQGGEDVGLVQDKNDDDAIFEPKKHADMLEVDEMKADKKERPCRIMLVFAGDGIVASDEIVAIATQVIDEVVASKAKFSGYDIDFFRINERTLWYSVLENPAACCTKWSLEADFVMPIVTPQLLRDINNNNGGESDGFTPTSPVINRHIYDLLRNEYMQNGSKNLRVRSVIPEKFVSEVINMHAFKMNQLFRTWFPMTREKVKARLTGMLDTFVENDLKKC